MNQTFTNDCIVFEIIAYYYILNIVIKYNILFFQVLPNGDLVFPPFRAEDYRQELHAQVYACLARSTSGVVTSRDVNVRAGRFV